MNSTEKSADAVFEASEQIRAATAAKKCWPCGCLHGALDAIEREKPSREFPPSLMQAVSLSREKLVEVKYDCLGCDTCFPAIALNALDIEASACPGDEVQARNGWPRNGWPSFPGNYRIFSFAAPVAVCTLTDDVLMQKLVAVRSPHLSIVGTLQTENLGIERLIENVVANPHLRFLILCGADSRQAIGHLPGQSLLALARDGVDERGRISGAPGRRPVLKNIARDVIEHFRHTVEVRDLIGKTDVDVICGEIDALAELNPGPVLPFEGLRVLNVRAGRLPEHMTSDPAGYFVIHIDRRGNRLLLEHYRNNGLVDDVISGRNAAEIYCTAIEFRHVSRLDHAAYLGRELARAEAALERDEPFVQDAAPAATLNQTGDCGCTNECGKGVQ